MVVIVRLDSYWFFLGKYSYVSLYKPQYLGFKFLWGVVGRLLGVGICYGSIGSIANVIFLS